MAFEATDVAHQVPIRKGNWETVAGRVSLSRPRWGPLRNQLARLIGMSASAQVQVRLDAMGSVAWHAMDGRSTAQVLQHVESEFPDEGRLAERLTTLLQLLVAKGFVGFVASIDERP